MAPGAQLSTVDAVRGRRRESAADRAYVAEIVSAGELRDLLHAHGRSDRAVAWVAARQLGDIATWQLYALGIGRSAIARRVRRGALHRLYRGVFLVGHTVPLPGARELAGVLACGDGALVSHRSAALLWGLTNAPALDVEVSVVARDCRPRAALRVHRLLNLDARDRALKNGIPVTAPARTLVDFAASAAPEELERALAEARAGRLVNDRLLSDALRRAGHRIGVGAVRASLRQDGGPKLTRSEAERRLLGMIRAARLPEPVTNARVAGLEVDLLWPDARLVVEVDGYAFHGYRAAFERDHRRDMALRDAGYEVVRVTWRQLVDEPLLVIAHLAQALERARGRYTSSASRP